MRTCLIVLVAMALFIAAYSVGRADTIFIPLVTGGAESQVEAAVAPYAGAPECAVHNDRRWHGLWNSTLGCHYDHLHGDNPRTVDDIFGTSYFVHAGGGISYPWATDGENHANHKHEGYKWLVRRDLPCESQFAAGCVKAFRAQAHNDLHNVASEYHSYAIEALVCTEAMPDDCGIVRFGGWQYAGDLVIDNQTVIDRPEPPKGPRPVLLHYANIGNKSFATWYPVSPSAIVRISQETADMWGYYPMPPSIPVPTLTIEDFVFFCDVDEAGNAPVGCTQNASRFSPHVIGVSIPFRHRAVLDPDGNGIADYQGYVDRYGAFVSGCTVVGLDCIPVSFEHVRIPSDGQFQYRGGHKEYDVTPAGASWIRFPN